MAKTIKLPKQIPQVQNLMDSLCTKNPAAARLLVRAAMDAIYPKTAFSTQPAWNDQQLEAVVYLIKDMKPKNSIELILACQSVAYYLMSMYTSAAIYQNSKGHGVMMARLSQQSAELLMKMKQQKAFVIDAKMEAEEASYQQETP